MISRLDPGEVDLLAANAGNEEDAALFEVAAFTGLLLGGLRGLRVRGGYAVRSRRP